MNRETLKQKMWYRGIKVLFILVFIFVQGFVFISNEEFANTQISMVLCDSGSEPARPLDEVSQSLINNLFCKPNQNDSIKVLSQDNRDKLENIVGKMEIQNSSQKEIQSFVNDFKEKNGVEPNLYTAKQLGYTKNPFLLLTDYAQNHPYYTVNYSIYQVNKYDENEIGIFSFVVISIIFWIISRMFFYVVTGKVFGSKNKV